MQSDMDEVVRMVLKGPMVDILAQLEPKLYRKYITHAKGKPILYVKLQKALYGTLRAALLFWRKLIGKLKREGFVVNPYDTYVANKMFEGKQCTVLWHVDDLKVSHVNPKVVSGVLDMLNAEFGELATLVVTRGEIQT